MTLEQQICEEGKHEGKLEGKREALVTALGTCFGQTNPGLTGQIEEIADTSVLDRLFVEVVGSASVGGFEALMR